MGRINWGKVFLGGLLAGVVINVGEYLFHAVLFKDQVAEMMRALGKDPATVMTGNAIVIWNILGFLTGIAAVWLYAAIRPASAPVRRPLLPPGSASGSSLDFSGPLPR
jgi:hypothetical protein